MGLSKDFRDSLDLASRGAFLNKINEKTPYTSIHYKLPEEEKESSPE
jgi:hypothetical protein